MDDSERISELADAVETLAHALERIASNLGDFQATGHAQVARQKAQLAIEGG